MALMLGKHNEKLPKWFTFLLSLVVSLILLTSVSIADDDDNDDYDEPEFLPGLVAEFRGENLTIHRRLDEKISFNWRGQSPDPRLSSDSFGVVWKGAVKIWTPGEHQFSVFSNGKVTVRVAGQTILENRVASLPDGEWMSAKGVDLEWGEQPIEVHFEKTGDEARINFFWSGPDFELEPVANHLLFHEPGEHPDGQFERGRLLSHALRCAACHTIADHQPKIAAPALDRLAGQIQSGWIVDWLTEKPIANTDLRDEDLARRMPHFDMTREEASAIASYLTSADSVSSPEESSKKVNDKAVEAGRVQFLTLGCLACHRVDRFGESGLFGGGDLSNVAQKRPADFFARWLKDPALLNSGHRMPVFTLSDGERSQLAAYLTSLKQEKEATSEPLTAVPTEITSASTVDLGRRLLKRYQCGRCHQLPKTETENSLNSSRLLSQAANWDKNCAGSNAHSEFQPQYGLSDPQRDAIRAYISQLPANLKKSDAAIDGMFVIQERNCLGCHGRGMHDGISKHLPAIQETEFTLQRKLALLKPPALDSVGDKLHRKSLHDAITTERGIRRPWLMVRMPKFRLSDDELAAMIQSLIDVDRIIPEHSLEPVVSPRPDFTSVAPRLVTTDGFGCTSCHKIGNVESSHAVPGVNGPQLGMLGEHIRQPWFERWVHNPARISPRMEMPAVKVPIRGVLDGTLSTQLEAVWQILNTPGFNPPEANPVRVIRRSNDSAQREQAAIIIDNVIFDDKTYVKPILIGLPNRHSVLFDLEQYRMAGWSVGDVARQRLRGKYWYWEVAGAPIAPASKGQSEISLVRDGNAKFPQIDKAFPPEFDNIELIESSTTGSEESKLLLDGPPIGLGPGLQFKGRLNFEDDDKEQQLVVEQRWQPLRRSTDSASGNFESTNGFFRQIRVRNLPPEAHVRFDVLPGSESQPGASAQETVSPDGRWRVTIVGGDAAFDSEHPGKVDFKSHGNGDVATLALVYRTTLPVDQYLSPVPPEVAVPQEVLHVAPGFDTVRLPLPETITPTAITQRDTGELLFSTLKGRLWQANDSNDDGVQDELKLLADGFSAPFGIKLVDKENGGQAIDLADKTALLRLFDHDNDSEIDEIKTIASGWGHSTDYHGWVVGIPSDDEGNYYLSVTNRNGPKDILRGRVMKLTPRIPTAENPHLFNIEPQAVGLRFPVGIARNRLGDLFVTDNQGQYNPYNEVNDVTSGGHFGFFNLKGLEDEPELKEMPQQGPAIGIPHPWVRSVNGICFLETPDHLKRERGHDLFGPFEGQMLGCEATTRKLVRISLQKVNGRNQGAAYPLTVEPPRGGPSILRPLCCTVTQNGDIYVGSVHDSAWGAGRNVGEIVRLRFNGELPTGIAEMRQTAKGFELLLTQPIDRKRALDHKNYSLASFRKIPTSAYGGPDVDRRNEKLTSLRVSEDGKKVELDLDDIRPGFVYELHLKNLTEKQELFHPAEAYYTVGPLP